MLARLARTCFRHRRLVLVAWLVVLVAAVIGGAALAGHCGHRRRRPASRC